MSRSFCWSCLVVLLLVSAADAQKTALPPLWRPLDIDGLDPAYKPWEDFYEYANGKWIARLRLPADKPRLYVFTLLQEENQHKLRRILEEAARQGAARDTIRGKVGAFYRSGMDEKAIEAAGVKPLKEEFDHIAGLHKREDVLPALARLHLHGVFAGFQFGSSPDEKDSRRTIAVFQQGGLGMPDRDYYLKDDANIKAVRSAYSEHLEKMFRLLGETKEDSARQAKAVLSLETRLAKASRTRVDLRDPLRNYHLLTVKELQEQTPAVPWKVYFERLGLKDLEELNVGQPDFLEELARLLKEAPLDDWKTYLRWHLVNAYADKLSTAFVEEDFHFKGKVLTGVKENRPRWQRVTESADHLLGEAVGQLYVAREFPPEAKARADALVRNIRETLRERLAGLDWMSERTRKQALKKLDAMAVKIGHPDRWRDYSDLAVDSDMYVVNVMAAITFEVRRDLAKIGKPTDRTEWHMTPPTVNAYYNPNLNEIVFPAGILQPPFFDAKADDAVNYGAIGMVIGHELTHGFDDQGRLYDAAGNLKEWWQPEDAQRYKERAAQIAEQYSGYVVLDGHKINGRLTLGENIADLGGLKIAYQALRKTLKDRPAGEKIQGYTPEQRYFLSFAQVWRGKTRPEAMRLRLLTDPHSPARFRVLGPLYNMPEFFDAFDVPASKRKARLNPQPVSIW
jgi:predicted metalloendopeptidase